MYNTISTTVVFNLTLKASIFYYIKEDNLDYKFIELRFLMSSAFFRRMLAFSFASFARRSASAAALSNPSNDSSNDSSSLCIAIIIIAGEENIVSQ